MASLEFFEVANEIRNAINHGDSIEEIEKSRNIKLSKIVDKLGSVAWAAILNTFRMASKDFPSAERLSLLKTNIYSHQVLTVSAHLIVYSSNPDEPKLSELAKPEISLVFPEDEEQKWPPPRNRTTDTNRRGGGCYEVSRQGL